MKEEEIKLSIVIPAFNEESAILSTLEPLRELLLSILKKENFEIILVDDGSTDSTAEIASTVSDIRVIKLPKNMGYGAAIKAGVRQAEFEWILLMGGDGQHKPVYIKDLIKTACKGYDMVIGARQKISHRLWYREPGKKILQTVANLLTNDKIPDLNSGMRIFRKKIFFKYESLYPNGFSITTTLTLASAGDGFALTFIPITTFPRIGRKSNVKIVRDGFNTLILIIRTISLFNPLRIFLPTGLGISIFGFFYGLLNIIRYNSLSKSAIVLIVVGVLIFLFGVLADQIALLRRQHNNS